MAMMEMVNYDKWCTFCVVIMLESYELRLEQLTIVFNGKTEPKSKYTISNMS